MRERGPQSESNNEVYDQTNKERKKETRKEILIQKRTIYEKRESHKSIH
jgi:hypothetical protein